MDPQPNNKAVPPIEKPPTEEKLRAILTQPDMVDVVESLIKRFKMPFFVENGELKSCYSTGELWLQKFITEDPASNEMKLEAMKIADTPYEVLIYGETGTGKELIAKSMIGKRKGSIKAVNCAGFPRELIEMELFGYVGGSFTGSSSRGRDGLIKEASGGVMFMDEIGELPLDVQAKLLRVLQEKRVRKIGGNSEEEIDCKFVFASNVEIRKMVEEGKFRQDLFARISTLELSIKPLRERKCDLKPICESIPGGKVFWDKYGDDVVEGLFDLSLNVRSLQQYVIRYSVLGRVKK